MMFQKYKRLPTTVEAVRFTDEDKDKIFNELTGQFAADFEGEKPVIKVTTAHGEIAIVRIGDWIVKDIKPGTYYPVKDSWFKDNYESINLRSREYLPSYEGDSMRETAEYLREMDQLFPDE